MLNYNELGLLSMDEVTEAVEFSVSADLESMDVTVDWKKVAKVALALGGAAAAAL